MYFSYDMDSHARAADKLLFRFGVQPFLQIPASTRHLHGVNVGNQHYLARLGKYSDDRFRQAKLNERPTGWRRDLPLTLLQTNRSNRDVRIIRTGGWPSRTFVATPTGISRPRTAPRASSLPTLKRE